MMHGFIRGLTLPHHLALEHLIVARSSFSQFVDHVRTTKRICIKTYGGGGKRPCH